MKISISEAAREDLIEGHRFYDRQSAGLGDYVYAILDCRRNPAWIRDRLT